MGPHSIYVYFQFTKQPGWDESSATSFFPWPDEVATLFIQKYGLINRYEYINVTYIYIYIHM